MIKTVYKASYVHKSNVKELIEQKIPKDKVADFKKFLQMVDTNFINYDIIKYDSGNITLITSPDWNTSNEPIVGDCYRWKEGAWFNADASLNLNYKKTRNFRQIYHNKWLFVADDYDGFDIEKAKKRTEEWNAIPNISDVKSKIGTKTFWVDFLTRNGLEV